MGSIGVESMASVAYSVAVVWALVAVVLAVSRSRTARVYRDTES